jgi:hypothetical protein
MDCLICRAPCRARPTHRPNLHLSNPERMGGIPPLPTIAAFVVVGVALILSIWARTCGMGVTC